MPRPYHSDGGAILSQLDVLERNKIQAKRYFANTIRKKFGLTFNMSDEVATVIALYKVIGGESQIWLGGQEMPLKDIQINMVLSLPQIKSINYNPQLSHIINE